MTYRAEAVSVSSSNIGSVILEKTGQKTSLLEDHSYKANHVQTARPLDILSCSPLLGKTVNAPLRRFDDKTALVAKQNDM